MPFHPTTTTSESDSIAIESLRRAGVKDPAGAISRMRSARKGDSPATIALAIGQARAQLRAGLRACGVDLPFTEDATQGAPQNRPKADAQRTATPVSPPPATQGGSSWSPQQASAFLSAISRGAGLTPAQVSAALANPDLVSQIATLVKSNLGRAAARRR